MNLKYNLSNNLFLNFCRDGNINDVKLFLVNYEIKTIDKLAGFKLACYNNYLDIVKLLYSNLYKVNIGGEDEYIFRYACSNGNLELIQWILEVRPKTRISIQNDYAFRYACRNGHLETAKYLYNLKKNINIHANDNHAFRFACMNNFIDIVKWLVEIDNEFDISFNDYFGFRIACEYGYFELAKFLNSVFFIDIHVLNEYAFRYACKNGNEEIMKWLLTLGNINIHAEKDYAFRFACENNHLEIVKFLYKFIEDKNIINNNLYVDICYFGHIDILQWFVEVKKDAYVRGVCFKNVCLNGFKNIAKYLYETMNEEITDDLFVEVCEYGRLEIVQWILEINHQINMKKAYEKAVWAGKIDIVRFLWGEDNSLVINDELFFFVCQNNYYNMALLLQELYRDRYVVNVIDNNVEYFALVRKLEFIIKNIRLSKEICSICSENQVDVITNCGHEYCYGCINKWYSKVQSCPYCRSLVKLVYGNV